MATLWGSSSGQGGESKCSLGECLPRVLSLGQGGHTVVLGARMGQQSPAPGGLERVLQDLWSCFVSTTGFSLEGRALLEKTNRMLLFMNNDNNFTDHIIFWTFQSCLKAA